MNNEHKLSAEGQTSAKKLVGMIKGVAKTYSTAHNLVQETALALIQHARDYNDCSLAKNLVWAVPARDRNLFISWLSHYSPIGVKLEKTELATKVGFMKPENKLMRARDEEGRPHWDIEGAKATPWTTDVTGTNPVEKPLNTLENFWDIIGKMIDREMKNAQKSGDDAKYDEKDREKVLRDAAAVKATLAQVRGTLIAKDVLDENKGLEVGEAAALGAEKALPVGIAA